MTQQSLISVDGLHAGLVQRLAQPLSQPGLINFALGHATLARSAQMVPHLPLSDALWARWGRSSANAGASSTNGQLPIVYVQPPLSAAPSGEAPSLPSPADHTQPDHTRTDHTQARQRAADPPQPAARPVVKAARKPAALATPPSTGRSVPATAERSQPALPMSSVAPFRSDDVTLPAAPTVASELPVALAAARPLTSSEATDRAHSPLPMATPSAPAAGPESAISSASASGTEGVIQRTPAKKRMAPLPLAQSHQPSEAAFSAETAKTESEKREQPSARVHSQPAVAPAAQPDVKLDFQTVRPLAAASAAQPSTLPAVRSALKTIAARAAPAPVASSALPVVRVLPAPASTAESVHPMGPRAQEQVAASPVVQAQGSQNGSQPASLPLRGAAPAAGGSSGVIQRTALPAAQTSSARSATRGVTPRRAVGVNAPVIQRTPAQVIQRAGDDDDAAEAAAEANELNIEAIVDRVQRQFMRRLEVERERRGGTSWR